MTPHFKACLSLERTAIYSFRFSSCPEIAFQNSRIELIKGVACCKTTNDNYKRWRLRLTVNK